MRVTVLYIGGVGRSGSSLLERLLDNHPEAISLGEIHQIFSNWLNFDKRQLCGCGEQFQECSFWREVLLRSIGPMETFDPAEWRKKREAVLGDRRRKELLFGLGEKAYYAELDQFLEQIAKVYRAIAEVSGAKVIVDSSKTAIWALALQRIPMIKVHFLHFVRNPYATAYSWQRKKKMPEVWWEERMMPIFPSSEIGKRWRATYVTSRLAAPRFTAYKRMHYEDFSRNPAKHLDEVVAFAGLTPLPLEKRLKDNKVSIAPGHTIMGNPMRVLREVVLKEDDAWRTGLSADDHKTVSKFVWPLRPFYRA